MTDNLIDNNNTDSLDPNKNYLTDLVGDGKKFKTNEDLAYGKAQSDSYIKILERQLDQLKVDYDSARSEAVARTRLEELVEKLNNPGQKPTVPETPPKTEMNMTELETLVDRRIQQTEVERKQRTNLDMVKTELSKRFGDNLEYHLNQVGLTGETAAALAKTNPELVLKALGAEKPQQGTFQAPPRNTSQGSPNRAPEQRTWSYYQKLFADPKNSHLKYDQKLNVQMQKDYQALGKAFEDGDFARFGETSF